MRRIILAYANDDSDPVALHAVRRALPVPRELRPCVGPDGYGKLFRELWLEGKPFILVENDVLPGPGMLNMLDGCTKPFCAHGYGPADHLPETGALFGLASFRPSGDVPFEKAKKEQLVNGVPHFEALADVVYASLAARGVQVHQHFPAVLHLTPWADLPEGEPKVPDAMAPAPIVFGGFGRTQPQPIPQPTGLEHPVVDTTPKK
jgi:hypothetical protein